MSSTILSATSKCQLSNQAVFSNFHEISNFREFIVSFIKEVLAVFGLDFVVL
jgi:hypothetical protein